MPQLVKNLLQGAFRRFRSNPAFSDVCVIAPGGERMHLHRVILSAKSAYLEECFASHDDDEVSSNGSGGRLNGSLTVDLQSMLGAVPAKYFVMAIDYMYTGEIELSDENSIPLLKIAERLLVEELRSLCQGYITSMLRSDTVLTFLRESVGSDSRSQTEVRDE